MGLDFGFVQVLIILQGSIPSFRTNPHLQLKHALAQIQLIADSCGIAISWACGLTHIGQSCLAHFGCMLFRLGSEQYSFGHGARHATLTGLGGAKCPMHLQSPML